MPFSSESASQAPLAVSKKILTRIRYFSRGFECFEREGCGGLEKLFLVFYAAKEASPDILLTKDLVSELVQYKRYIALWKGRKIPTDFIKRISGIEPGRMLGDIIRETRKAEFLKEIKTRAEAKKFIQERALLN